MKGVFVSRTEEDTKRIAGELAKHLKGNEVICLVGDLGAGKTTFVKGLAEAMGIREGYQVRSPTFSLIHQYPTTQGNIFHVDLYRVDYLDLEEVLGEGLVVIEWPKDMSICQIVVEITEEGHERLIKIYTNNHVQEGSDS
ncbi:protein of unknown function UPF0079 [Thermocrinis albus DSM 14484]|uniref:tRNA threonylcarbamoyladenosine biosynthesis protein TsaE n=1 Tax=Thermocrinis albus (strain DSM 14484 / JCM 11386 / HI 11/12) TaxID=638303 RepID=D3SLD8_THEAH|nr:tRNA (adenosine(37)-N6)-threonylcarbamoyltransferase complex ATPase subunit type 1 TsaE [Thermocrinis albus]ADC89568.1 protein of unknown function UPF0079 [Thermocrinis albus DSM 14484]